MHTMLETGTYRSVPRRISQLTSFVTSENDLFVLAHLGIPEVTRDDWTMSIGGMVERPLRLRFSDLAGFDDYTMTSFHKCAGNPMKPAEPTPDRVGNVVWRGVRLSDVLRRAGYAEHATHVWIDGYDSGQFEGMSIPVYQKDLPIEKALQDEVLLAFEINGAPLSAYRGGPVRLVVPGWYGTNSVKWVSAIKVADRRAGGHFTTTWYNDTDAAGVRHPVWSVVPDSAIVSLVAGEKIDAGWLDISGWSWGDRDIARVEVSTDAGKTWLAAELSPRIEKSWQAFSIKVPKMHGSLNILSRATDITGAVQPMSGARNASVMVDVFASPDQAE